MKAKEKRPTLSIVDGINRLLGLLLTIVIQCYRVVLSPLFPSKCRHIPSCSTYALKAIRSHGAFRGGILAFKRIVKCHPWGSYGYDPVPEKKMKQHCSGDSHAA